jgi:amino acid transporter
MIPKEGWDLLKFKGFKWRLIVSIIIPLGAMIFLIIWFWEPAIPYTIWQNIAVFLVVLLIMAAILSVIWIGWGKKYGEMFEKQAEEVGQEIEKRFEGKDEESE